MTAAGVPRRRGDSRRRATMPRSRCRGTAAAALVLVALALSASGASATMVVAKDFTALCNEASFIFVGTVTNTESRWSDASQQAIETLVTFGDLTWLYGAPQPSVTLRFAGGEMDGLREEIAGVPHFALGERRVIFARDGRFVSPLVGFDQGALRVVDGADGPTVIGVEPPTGAQGALRLGVPGSTAGVPLDTFVERVRQQLQVRDGAAQ